MKNFYKYLLENSNLYKNKNALIFNEEKISYSELLKLVDSCTEEFKKKYKLNLYNKISIFMENSIEYILIILIACKLNLSVQTLGTYYSQNLIKNRLRKFKPKIIFTKKHLLFFFKRNDKKVKVFDYKISKRKIYNNKNFIKKGLNRKLLAVESSGTTGSSKTVIFSEKCKILRSLSAINTYKLTNKDIFISTAPFDHSVGHRQIFLPIILGSTNIILKNFHPKLWIENIKKYKVSFTLLVSTQITKIIETLNLNMKNTKYLKNIVSVSTKLNHRDKKKLLKLDVILHEMYGTCEIGTATSINLKREKNKSKSVGKALNKYKIKILNNKKFCKPNEIGEIICKSPNKFEEYMGFNTRQEKKFFFKDYFRTGDLGYLDSDNYLFFIGRKKNLVKINGLSVYPEEIEKKIKKHFNYNNFVITGSKDINENEKLVIYVENFSKYKITKLNNFFNFKLEKYEIPSQIINLNKFPRTNLGKINLSEIKKNEI